MRPAASRPKIDAAKRFGEWAMKNQRRGLLVGRFTGVFGLVVAAARGLGGCTDVITVHSLDAYAPETLPAVPDLSGIWVMTDLEEVSYVALQFVAEAYDVAGCREMQVALLQTESENPPVAIGQRICFIPIAGHLLAEMRSADTVPMHRHFLVRVEDNALAVCGGSSDILPLYLLAAEDMDEAVAGLDYTVREEHYDKLIVVTSKPEPLLAYFERVLPRIAEVCDKSAGSELGWLTFKRVTPLRKDESAAAEQPAVEP
jgi:hypothetical protein